MEVRKVQNRIQKAHKRALEGQQCGQSRERMKPSFSNLQKCQQNAFTNEVQITFIELYYWTLTSVKEY